MALKQDHSLIFFHFFETATSGSRTLGEQVRGCIVSSLSERFLWAKAEKALFWSGYVFAHSEAVPAEKEPLIGPSCPEQDLKS